jgi:2',3'-cyclic-nucleotide 2'-phosphodiesterase (5'-nucleotidase family)
MNRVQYNGELNDQKNHLQMKRIFNYVVLVILLQACQRNYHVTNTSHTHYELKKHGKDSVTIATVLPYKNKLDHEMKTVIAISDSALTREGFEPSVGNFMLQSMDHYISVHHPQLKNDAVLIVNRGGLRNDLPKGTITKGNIFELMPFDNEIVILSIKGNKLQECINAIATYKKLLAFNLKFRIKNNMPEDVFVLGKKIDPEAEYKIVTTDYLANGGDNCSFFTKPSGYSVTKIKLRDAIISYCEFLTQNNQHIKPFVNGTIVISK